MRLNIEYYDNKQAEMIADALQLTSELVNEYNNIVVDADSRACYMLMQIEQNANDEKVMYVRKIYFVYQPFLKQKCNNNFNQILLFYSEVLAIVKTHLMEELSDLTFDFTGEAYSVSQILRRYCE